MGAAPNLVAPAQSTIIATGGKPQVVFYGPLNGGRISNPYSNTDQGIGLVEPLFVSLVAPPPLAANITTFAIQPGGWFTIPKNTAGPVWVNAATKGHRFSAVAVLPPQNFQPSTSTFPPAGPTSLTQILPSYLYEQYQDDLNLQSFVTAQNTLAQSYADWSTDTPLPVYTSPAISGVLLDWVALGRYGMARPALPSGRNHNIGAYNTATFNELEYNQEIVIGNQNVYATTDDIFKRILTWHEYKGDGKVFTVPWFKRRIMRFLFGVNGTDPPVDNTYPVSISFGGGGQVNITIAAGMRTVVGGALYNEQNFNTFNYGEIDTLFTPTPPIPEAVIFKAAMDAGVLEVPFQFTYVVNVG